MYAGTRLPFVIRRTVELLRDPLRLRVSTTIENMSADRQPFVWGEHPAFLAGPGDQIDVPAGPVQSREAPDDDPTMWPTDPMGDGDLDRVPEGQVAGTVHFLPERAEGWVALRRPHVGFALSWDVADYPNLWLWRELGSTGFPFYGRASIVALEPVSIWPGDGLAAAIDRGQANWLAGGEQRSTAVTVVPFRPTGQPVTGIDECGAPRL